MTPCNRRQPSRTERLGDPDRNCRVALLLTALAVAGFGFPAFAWAQNAPIQATQLPPLQEQTQPFDKPPVIPRLVAPAPGPPVPAAPDVPGPAVQSQPPAAVTPPLTVERPNVWLPGTVARLQALDKVNAQSSELAIKVGQSATFGSLTITVKSCMVRPPDQPADAAAYLDVIDSHPDSPGFDGWLLQDEPSVSMMQHPIYDLRVAGCA